MNKIAIIIICAVCIIGAEAGMAIAIHSAYQSESLRPVGKAFLIMDVVANIMLIVAGVFYFGNRKP